MFSGAGNLVSGGSFFAGGEEAVAWYQAAAIHGVAGCVTSAASGGQCGPGALSAAVTKTFANDIMARTGRDGVAGTIMSAVIGGTVAELGGGKFANGAVTGAYGYLFNQVSRGAAGASPVGGSGLVGNAACVEYAFSCSESASDRLSRQISGTIERWGSTANANSFQPAEVYALRAEVTGFYRDISGPTSLTWLQAGDVWHIGKSIDISTPGYSRYSASQLQTMAGNPVSRETLWRGGGLSVRINEKITIFSYEAMNGRLPLGNGVPYR